MKHKELNNKWFPRYLTESTLSVILAILSGIVINLITNSFPTSNYLLIFSLTSIILLILSLIATLILLLIRNQIDNILTIKTLDNASSKAEIKITPTLLWETTLKELYLKLFKRYTIWKRLGILSLASGLLVMFYVNIKNFTDNIQSENWIHKNTFGIVDSLHNMNLKLTQHKIIILQLSDSIQSIKKRIHAFKPIKIEKETQKLIND